MGVLQTFLAVLLSHLRSAQPRLSVQKGGFSLLGGSRILLVFIYLFSFQVSFFFSFYRALCAGCSCCWRLALGARGESSLLSVRAADSRRQSPLAFAGHPFLSLFSGDLVFF